MQVNSYDASFTSANNFNNFDQSNQFPMQYQQQPFNQYEGGQFMGLTSVVGQQQQQQLHQGINNGSTSSYQHSINDLLVQPTATLQQNLFSSQDAVPANQSVSCATNENLRRIGGCETFFFGRFPTADSTPKRLYWMISKNFVQPSGAKIFPRNSLIKRRNYFWLARKPWKKLSLEISVKSCGSTQKVANFTRWSLECWLHHQKRERILLRSVLDTKRSSGDAKILLNFSSTSKELNLLPNDSCKASIKKEIFSVNSNPSKLSFELKRWWSFFYLRFQSFCSSH